MTAKLLYFVCATTLGVLNDPARNVLASFSYVFGGAIATGTKYINFYYQVFCSDGIVWCHDDRHWSRDDLSKASLIVSFVTDGALRVLAGRTIADLMRNMFVVFHDHG